MINGIRVKYEHPQYGPVSTELCICDELSVRRINEAMDDDNPRYYFNDFFPACKVLSVESCKVPTREDLTMNGKFGCE